MSRLPLVIGHRGAAGHAPENTLAAFRKGLALGADGIECDVHMSRDGHLVVIHDETVDRTTDGTGRVGDLDLSALQALDAGSWYDAAFAGERIPTLSQLVDAVLSAEREQGRELRLIVELKHGDERYPGIEERLVGALAATALAERTVVIGFDHRAMARVKRLRPSLTTGVLYDARPVDALSLARAAGADMIGPSVKWLEAQDVAAAREAGIGVFVWTASTEATMRKVVELAVTAAGSDLPDRLLAMRSNRCFPASNSF